ncbi:hypothetical protein QVD17_11190 [Tagetes erecta]|uniref:Uncharacterized protein n=1 Tax=Tagetes erecta TaxID=13708 RepID=A0AAD8KXN2_TARER|nr:hypothetical protein QVD17_11190 [Tagetes erecta]
MNNSKYKMDKKERRGGYMKVGGGDVNCDNATLDNHRPHQRLCLLFLFLHRHTHKISGGISLSTLFFVGRRKTKLAAAVSSSHQRSNAAPSSICSGVVGPPFITYDQSDHFCFSFSSHRIEYVIGRVRNSALHRNFVVRFKGG